MIPEGVDVFIPEGPAYVWFHITEGDLCVEEWGIEEWGQEWIVQHGEDLEDCWSLLEDGITSYKKQEWLVNELDASDWTTILDLGIYDRNFGYTCVPWMLENGIAPGQPFLLCIQPPKYSGGSYYDPYDVDVDWDIDLVRVLPLDASEALARWERVLSDLEDDRKIKAFEAERLERMRRAAPQRTDKMRLETEVFFTDPPYADEATPNGVRIILSAHDDAMYYRLAIGESDRGDRLAAMQDLVLKAARDFPHLSEDFIRNLPRGRII